MEEEGICPWVKNCSEILRKYHNEEWGKPLHDDKKLFEQLMLEVFSCGLSWELILKKREHLNEVFDNFDPEIVSQYTDEKVDELMQDPGIIRHRGKILAVINNSKIFLEMTKEGTLDDFLWKYVDYKPIINNTNEFITKNEISDQISKDLKALGFKFIGSTTIYAFMQSVGMVNDHVTTCPYK